MPDDDPNGADWPARPNESSGGHHAAPFNTNAPATSARIPAAGTSTCQPADLAAPEGAAVGPTSDG
ncbi:hypothetical protein [Acidipropionibacterium timonense]|uniref:hypothetical protein n=1 Tax=Acidipropionibacterium timonense TaxID=2161818 RepID=UPI001FDA0D73|nr:hypothetical protein [Acidipropionibacterium timonense]